MNAPASHCCRALQRQIVPSRDSVWIADSLLASAFERYCNVSRTWNRKASNVPGPLESQRRLGRRRMGDINAWQCPPTPPPWAFSVPLNLSKWTWEPPTSAYAVEQGQSRRDLMPGWLQELLPQRAEQPSMALSVLPLPDVSLSTAHAAPDRPSFTSDMETFRWAVTHATDATLESYVENIARTFQHLIFLGEIAPSDVMPLASEIWSALDSRFRGSDLFTQVMAALPAAYQGMASEGILSVLNRFFSSWSCSKDEPDAASIAQLLNATMSGQSSGASSGSLRQAIAISTALQSFSPEEPGGLLRAANTLVLRQTTISARLRYNWLCVLALLPRVSQDFWFDLAAVLSDASRETRPMTGVELCSLLLTQWKSRGYIKCPRRFYGTYTRYSAGHDEAAIASLFMTIFRHEQRETHTGLYWSAWRLLTKLNLTDYALRSLAFDAASFELPLSMLQNLAWTCDDHRIAIRIRDWYMNELRQPRGPEWNPAVFEKYAKRIVLDSTLSPKEIWRVLGINAFENRRKSTWEKTRRHRGTYGKSRVQIVKEVSTVFANAPHLPNRVAFRHVYQAFRYIEAIEGRVPLAVIMDLYHVLTRDLVHRQPGRTKRLLWFVTVLQRTYGVELAWNCRLALRHWRHRLKQAWLDMGGNGGP
ncbi:hypothetical protein N656DRAFT_701374 [Canariomyces notabilis]|uniref:Uncharacterized protein n=1 Tax=Canariomyces notabilis TaxID=2074819 RepID=A0AAN6TLX0_9PEZI|nr:hypothetical protein N656DRAFT_701374 [Canariomyces arenarius]